MSRIYFPLKTSVELFGDRETPKAVARVKQAAALYDDVLVEDGLLTVNVSTAGSNSFWEPWDWVDPEKLAHTRTPGEPGTPIGIGVQAQPGAGQPGEGPVRWFPQGELLVDYAAEFHTGVIDELAPLEPDWFHIVAPGNTAGALRPELSAAVRGLDQRDFFDRNLMTDRNTFEKGWIFEVIQR